MSKLDLDGRTAIVTGAGSNLGLAVVLRLLASGAAVSVWDRDIEALAEIEQRLRESGRCHSVIVDVTSADAVVAAVGVALSEFSKIDVLVNIAGMVGPDAAPREYPGVAWNQVLAINLTGPFLCCRAVVPHMLSRNYGRIVNVTSAARPVAGYNVPACSVSNAGLITFTNLLGRDLAASNVRVNSVTPATLTMSTLDPIGSPQLASMMSKALPDLYGTTAEIAAFVTWLCTEECSFSIVAESDLAGDFDTY